MEICTRQTYKQILEEIFRDSVKERLGRYLAEDEINARKEKDLIIGCLLKTGKISPLWVMRKFQCTIEKAEQLIIRATSHECAEWDGSDINYFDPEFEKCKCFQ